MSLTAFHEDSDRYQCVNFGRDIHSSASRRLRDKIIVDHEITLSNAILQELARTLSDKFGFDGTSVSEITDGLIRVAEIVEPVIFETQICRDPDDDAILGTAVAGNADCIVTGDSDLLVLERFQGVDIISPSEFAEYEVGRA